MAIDFEKVPTPCFLLDEQSLEINLQILNLVQREANVKIICALKGFAFWHEFPLVGRYLSGATASSLHEAILIAEEMSAESHTYCPVYKEDEFESLLAYSSHLTFNSLTQYAKFYEKAKSFGKEVSLGLRINPEYSEIKTDLYNPAMEGSRLGIVRAKLGNTLPEGIEGLHFHVLCENDSYTLERTLVQVEEKFGDLIRQEKWLNMGGGHLITKEGYDVEHLVNMLKDFRKRYPNMRRPAFDAVDGDKDGAISLEEWRVFFQGHGMTGGAPPGSGAGGQTPPPGHGGGRDGRPLILPPAK